MSELALKKNDLRLSTAKAFRMPIGGPPASALPKWGGTVETDQVRFILHAPVDYEIAYNVPSYVFVLPFSNMVFDLSLNDAPARRVVMAGGTGMMVPPETTVRAKTLEPVEFLIMDVEDMFVVDAITDVMQGRVWSPKPVIGICDPAISALMCEMRRTLLADDLVEPVYLTALARALTVRFVYRCKDTDTAQPVKETLSPYVLRQVTRMIADRLGDTLKVEDIARDNGMSRSHFSRAFRATTGQSPKEYILARRINRARELLSRSSLGISEIAHATGFSSQAHLSSTFKAHVGISPAKYRATFDD